MLRNTLAGSLEWFLCAEMVLNCGGKVMQGDDADDEVKMGAGFSSLRQESVEDSIRVGRKQERMGPHRPELAALEDQ